MSELMQASHQWATRPSDERYTSLVDMQRHFETQRSQSKAAAVNSRKLLASPTEDNKGIVVAHADDQSRVYAPSHWAFGQLAARAEAPAGYLRTLHPALAADCVNYGLQYKRDIEDVGVLLQSNGYDALRAVTGPNYGRIWNSDIVAGLVKNFGDGTSGRFKVPGEFGKDVVVTKDNTTLFAGDRDMFVFLADEKNRIEVPGRRNGQTGSMARGFFLWNSEVGSKTFGLATFLFDYVCCNRIVWGAGEYNEVIIRHTVSAPDRFLEEMQPTLESYANGSARGVQEAIAAAQAKKVDNIEDFVAKRFGKRMFAAFNTVHQIEEQRPMETLWDVTTAATAYARGVKWQDDRVAIEREAGKVLDLVAVKA